MWVSGLLALGSGALSWYSKDQQRRDQIDEYNNQLEGLNNDYNHSLSTLEQNYNKDQRKLDNAITALDTQIGQEKDNQNRNYQVGSKAAAENSDILNLEYSRLLAESSNNEGIATSNSATSGFRLSDSALNLKQIAKNTNSKALQSFKLKADLQNSQSYNSVASSYIDSANKIQNYQFLRQSNVQDKKDSTSIYNENKNYLNSEYQRKSNYIQDQVDYLDNQGFWATLFGSAVSTGASTVNAWSNKNTW